MNGETRSSLGLLAIGSADGLLHVVFAVQFLLSEIAPVFGEWEASGRGARSAGVKSAVRPAQSQMVCR